MKIIKLVITTYLHYLYKKNGMKKIIKAFNALLSEIIRYLRTNLQHIGVYLLRTKTVVKLMLSKNNI